MTKPDLSKATPRPWRVEAYRYSKRGQVYTRPAAVISGDGKHWIANSVMGHNFDGSSEANAALIVAAVNTYDKARELAELVKLYRHAPPNIKGWQQIAES